MLILPLHRPLTRASFPLVTLALLLANLAVFVLLQSGDGAARARALQYYVESGLAERERPAYLAHLPDAERAALSARLQSVPEPMQHALLAERIGADQAFSRKLAAGSLPGFDPAWQRQRSEYQALRARVFTDRHVQRYDRVQPLSAVTAAFLHGGGGHLLGNLVFLALLGLLVEPVLGGLRFLGLYLAGALGAALAGWAWNWGEPGGVLGASGAIAALMGACSVLWAGRKVRVFYWAFVVFDYVRMPALLLLPLWLGWELLQLARYGGSAGVAFDAHAGGLLTGASVALLLRRAGWWHPEALEDAAPPDRDAGLLQQALAHLGRLETRQADALLEELAHRQPRSFAVSAARFRCARLSGAAAATVAARAADLLGCPARAREERQQQLAVAAELDAAGLALALPARLALLRALLAAGEAEQAVALLQPASGQGHAPGAAGPLSQAWLDLGVALHDRGAAAAAREAWQTAATRFGDVPAASKARFLLEAHASPA